MYGRREGRGGERGGEGDAPGFIRVRLSLREGL